MAKYFNAVIGQWVDDGQTDLTNINPAASIFNGGDGNAPKTSFDWVHTLSTLAESAAVLISATKGNPVQNSNQNNNAAHGSTAAVTPQVIYAQPPPVEAKKDNTTTFILVIVGVVVLGLVVFFLTRKK